MSSSISLFLAIINPKVVLKMLLSLLNLAGAQILCLHEPAEIIVIGDNKNLIFAVFQIITPSIESLNNN